MVNRNSKSYQLAQQLGEVYINLKYIMADLQEIYECIETDKRDDYLLISIRRLEQVDHDITKLANKLAKED